MFRFSGLLVCVLFATTVFAEPATFVQCPNTEVESENVEVDVSSCNSTVACPLYRGTNHDFVVKFTPTVDGPVTIERAIIALFAGRTGRSGIEVPYGGATPASNTTKRDSDGEEVQTVGLTAGQAYTHRDIFNVMSSAPPASLRVRYIIRESRPNLSRRQSKWNRHPGTKFACVEIPVQLI